MDTYIISKLIVKERVTLPSLYIQLVRLLAYFTVPDDMYHTGVPIAATDMYHTCVPITVPDMYHTCVPITVPDMYHTCVPITALNNM